MFAMNGSRLDTTGKRTAGAGPERELVHRADDDRARSPAPIGGKVSGSVETAAQHAPVEPGFGPPSHQSMTNDWQKG